MAENKLTKINDFKQVLEHYQLSDEARQSLDEVHLVLLVGPSSSGRNTIINYLVDGGMYHYVLSDTTRKPRVNNGILEQNGREYWFRTEDEILDDLKTGKFLEAAIIHEQQVSGVSIRELHAAANEHKIAINEIEPVGADNVHAASGKVKFFFVIPPSFDEWIARMSARGPLPADETKRRLESAVKEIGMALERDYYTFVVNDTFIHAAARIDNVVQGDGLQADDQAVAKAIAAQLLEDTKRYLTEL